MLIRRETDADIAAIDAVHRAAFARLDTHVNVEPPEVVLVRALRTDVGWIPGLSLVAEHTTSTVVDHVVCTVASIDDDLALGLGPLGVSPDHQRRGVGHALMHAVVGAADALGFAVVVLLGSTDYYRGFGFTRTVHWHHPSGPGLGRSLPGPTAARVAPGPRWWLPLRRPIRAPLTDVGPAVEDAADRVIRRRHRTVASPGDGHLPCRHAVVG